MVIEKDMYEEIALGLGGCEEMPLGAHWSYCSAGQEPGDGGLSRY